MSRDTLRLEKWFWYARFIKSRSLATKLCNSGKVRVNGSLIKKAHQSVAPGDVLTFPAGPNIRVIKIIKLGNRRGPAKEAQALYEDMQPIHRVAQKIDSPLTISIKSYFFFKSTIPIFLALFISSSFLNKNLP